MSQQIDGYVQQVIPYMDLDDYLIPSETADSVRPGEDLVVVLQDRVDWYYKLTGIPVLGFLISVLMVFPRAVPQIRRALDHDPVEVVVDSGMLSEDEEVSIVVEEAVVVETVVDGTRSRRGAVEDRTVYAHELIEIVRVDGDYRGGREVDGL